MSSDSEPMAKRVKIIENNDDAVKVSAFEGKIEALISQDHPKHRHGEMPDGFSKLVMSPTNRYGAEIHVFYQPHSSLVVKKSRKSAMIRIIDFATLTYRYYWFDQTDFPYSKDNDRCVQTLVTGIYWLDDENLILVFGQTSFNTAQDCDTSTLDYGMYKIDHQLQKLERVWYKSGDVILSPFRLTFCIPGLLTVNDEKYFVLTDAWCFYFVSITDREFEPVRMRHDFGHVTEKQYLIQDGFLYHLKLKNHKFYLVRVNSADIDLNSRDWFYEKQSNEEYDELIVPRHSQMFYSYNKDHILLQWLNSADEFGYHLVDLRNFTWKELSFRGNRGEFAVLYNDYVVLFNHFSDRAYPLKDTPLKFRGFQITGSVVPSLKSLAGTVAVFSGTQLSVDHLPILFALDTEQ